MKGPLVGKEIDQGVVELCLDSLKTSLQQIEKIYLKDSEFISSDHMTIADLIGVCELMQSRFSLNMDVYTGFPRVEQWCENVRKTVGTQLFDETHKFIGVISKHFTASGMPSPKL